MNLVFGSPARSLPFVILSALRLADPPAGLIVVDDGDEWAEPHRLLAEQVLNVVDDITEAALLANRFLQEAQQRRVRVRDLHRIMAGVAQQAGVRIAAPVGPSRA